MRPPAGSPPAPALVSALPVDSSEISLSAFFDTDAAITTPGGTIKRRLRIRWLHGSSQMRFARSQYTVDASRRATWFKESWKTTKHGPWDEYGYLREGWIRNRQGFPYRGDVGSEPGAVKETWDAYGVVMIAEGSCCRVQELEKAAEQELLANDGVSNAVPKLLALARGGNEEAHEAVLRVSTTYWSAEVARWTLLCAGCC